MTKAPKGSYSNDTRYGLECLMSFSFGPYFDKAIVHSARNAIIPDCFGRCDVCSCRT